MQHFLNNVDEETLGNLSQMPKLNSEMNSLFHVLFSIKCGGFGIDFFRSVTNICASFVAMPMVHFTLPFTYIDLVMSLFDSAALGVVHIYQHL